MRQEIKHGIWNRAERIRDGYDESSSARDGKTKWHNDITGALGEVVARIIFDDLEPYDSWESDFVASGNVLVDVKTTYSQGGSGDAPLYVRNRHGTLFSDYYLMMEVIEPEDATLREGGYVKPVGYATQDMVKDAECVDGDDYPYFQVPCEDLHDPNCLFS